MRGKIKTALKILRTYIYSKAHLTIAVSSFTKQKLVESGVNPSKIKVFHNGVDLENFESGDKYDDIIEKHKLADKKIILTVARISEHKGHDMVIRSLPSVIERIPNVVYLIAGRGSHEIVLKSLVRDLNLEDHVIFLGYVSNADLPKLYNTCDVFIMTSRETSYSVEGFGISFIEASACKKPVIGGKSGGIPDAIVDKVTGLVVNPEDSHEIATALTAVLCDTALANEMGENGYRRVKGGLTWDKIVEDIVKTL
jgi:phosphatidylinositol alpha-1,6-mannosyltransferase